MQSIKNILLVILMPIGITTTRAQETLAHYHPDQLVDCAYIADLVNLGVVFHPESSWTGYRALSLAILYADSTFNPGEPVVFYAYTDRFPGREIDTVWALGPDTTEPDLYWVRWDLRDSPALQILSGALSITGQALFSDLCD